MSRKMKSVILTICFIVAVIAFFYVAAITNGFSILVLFFGFLAFLIIKAIYKVAEEIVDKIEDEKEFKKVEKLLKKEDSPFVALNDDWKWQ